MSDQTYQPLRTCAGCRKKCEKEELIRVARTKDGSVLFDRTGKAGGRGAYLCRNPECLEKAKKKSALSRILRTGIPDEIYAELGKELE